GGHPLLILTTVELFGHPITVKGPIDSHCRHLRHPSKPLTQQQLPVGAFMTTPPMAHQDEGYWTILLRRGPQDARDYAGLTLKVKSVLRDPTFADRFVDPSQCSHMPSWSKPKMCTFTISSQHVVQLHYSGSHSDTLRCSGC